MAEIIFLPVCSSCKSILMDVEIDCEEMTQYIGPPELRKHEIKPRCCPVCGEQFSELIMDMRLPFYKEGKKMMCERKEET